MHCIEESDDHMKKHLMISISMLFVFIAITPALAARSISFPFELKFDSGDNWTADLAWEDCGGTVTHVTLGCWSGGCAKITPPTSACAGGGINGGMASLGNFEGFSTERLNIRMLLKVGPTYYRSARDGGGTLENKFIDVHGGNDGNARLGILGFQAHYTSEGPPPNTDYYAFGPMSNPYTEFVFASPPSGGGIENSPFRVSDTAHHGGEWICVEYEINTNADTTSVVITEANGNQTTIRTPSSNTGNMNRFYIGGYHNGFFVPDPDTYMLIDELKVSNTYIGPPPTFIGSVPTPDPTPDPTPGANSGSASSGSCFIATAAFGSHQEPSVMILREFRDRFMLSHRPGRAAVSLYYRYSPPIADLISKHEEIKMLVRLSLIPVVGMSWLALKMGIFFFSGFILILVILIAVTISACRNRISMRE
jgi:hypothetical protein